ncbi:unnamed protein product [Prorocentrum cordatum]|uniref:Uncharacterized protein n=1 Tax=Prorocentrum cordatum TaxID=2364126 RepID=A0ABN9V2R0_9DINO|nr:unnamed protein product [Polarella glacialis]
MTNNGRLVRLPSGTLTGGPPSCGRGTPPDTCPLAAPGKQPRRGGSGTLRYSDSTPVATPSMLWPQTPTTPFAMGMMPPWPEGALQGPPGGGGGALASASAAADALFAAAVAATTRQHAATAGSLAAQVPQASRRQRSRRHSARAPPGQARSPAAAATRPPRARRGRCCTTAASAAARAHGTTSRRGASSRPPARTATRARRASSRGARRPRSRRCARASLSPRLPPLERSGHSRPQPIPIPDMAMASQPHQPVLPGGGRPRESGRSGHTSLLIGGQACQWGHGLASGDRDRSNDAQVRPHVD